MDNLGQANKPHNPATTLAMMQTEDAAGQHTLKKAKGSLQRNIPEAIM